MNNEIYDVSYLKPGYVIEIRDGTKFLVAETEDGITLVTEKGTWLAPCQISSNPGRDNFIVKVYGFSGVYVDAITHNTAFRELLWEYNNSEIKKLTIGQIEKLLGYPIEIVSEANNE